VLAFTSPYIRFIGVYPRNFALQNTLICVF
jgi:hypothetical protein